MPLQFAPSERNALCYDLEVMLVGERCENEGERCQNDVYPKLHGGSLVLQNSKLNQ